MFHSSPRRFFVIFFGSLITLCAVLAAINFTIDPLQYYRIPTLYKPVFWVGLQRYQVATLARRYAQRVVVIGQSTTENFLPSYIQSSWGKPASKLSISASTAHEQFLALRLALQTGRVTDVLWGADGYGFRGSPTRTNDSQSPFPVYMYRDDPISQLKYLLSAGTLRLSLLIMTGNALSSDLEHYHTWYDRFEFSEKSVLATWNRKCAVFSRKYHTGDRAPSPRAAAAFRASIDRNLLSLARQYPRVTFHVFFPPYSVMFYIPPATGNLPMYLNFRSVLAASLVNQANVRLSDFQIAEPIVDDLNNYKDTVHFSLRISKYIIDSLRDGKYLVRPQEIGRNNERLIEIVNGYDLCKRHGTLSR